MTKSCVGMTTVSSSLFCQVLEQQHERSEGRPPPAHHLTERQRRARQDRPQQAHRPPTPECVKLRHTDYYKYYSNMRKKKERERKKRRKEKKKNILRTNVQLFRRKDLFFVLPLSPPICRFIFVYYVSKRLGVLNFLFPDFFARFPLPSPQLQLMMPLIGQRIICHLVFILF